MLFTLPRNMVCPSLLSLMCTPRLPVVDRTDAPADLNGLVRFVERRNLVSARCAITFQKYFYPEMHLHPYGTPRLVAYRELKSVRWTEASFEVIINYLQNGALIILIPRRPVIRNLFFFLRKV